MKTETSWKELKKQLLNAGVSSVDSCKTRKHIKQFWYCIRWSPMTGLPANCSQFQLRPAFVLSVDIATRSLTLTCIKVSCHGTATNNDWGCSSRETLLSWRSWKSSPASRCREATLRPEFYIPRSCTLEVSVWRPSSSVPGRCQRHRSAHVHQNIRQSTVGDEVVQLSTYRGSIKEVLHFVSNFNAYWTR